MSDGERAAKMENLKVSLMANLRQKFEQEVGYPMPSVHDAEILSADVALMDYVEARKVHFLAGVRILTKTKFGADSDSQIREWVFGMADTAMNKIFNGPPQNGTNGYHAFHKRNSPKGVPDIFVAAIYASIFRGVKEEWGTERDFYLSQYVFTVFKARLDRIVGKYECHVYDGTTAKNDWHYVTVSKISKTEVEWANKAGVKWKLTATMDRAVLLVGPECTYHKSGYQVAKVVWEGGRVVGLLGPHNELYKKFE